MRGAERALNAAAIELRSSRASLTVQALQAYANARNAAAAQQLAAAQLTLAETLLKVAQEQREQNLIPQVALLERQAAAEQARAGAEQAGRGLTLAAAQLLAGAGARRDSVWQRGRLRARQHARSGGGAGTAARRAHCPRSGPAPRNRPRSGRVGRRASGPRHR
ncbi:TolC family protein [Deinococcus radiodurans]|uniref:TolC family protein n=1 Tax=Deinococcus radiodurans TaxID=1299 RepID=UPI001F48F317|nr:TolC family protein [Deinococcus radiodurans]